MPSVYPGALDVISNKIDHVDTFNADDINTPAGGVMSLQALIGSGATVPTANATPSTLMKRNANGDVSINTINALIGVQLARSTPSVPIFALDSANLGATFTIANNATEYPFGLANNFCGIFAVKDIASDHSFVAMNAGHGLFQIADSSAGALFTTNPATATRILVATHGSIFCPALTNKLGSTKTVSVTCLFRWDSVS